MSNLLGFGVSITIVFCGKSLSFNVIINLQEYLNLEPCKFVGELARVKLPDGDLAIQTAGRELGNLFARTSVWANLTKCFDMH